MHEPEERHPDEARYWLAGEAEADSEPPGEVMTVEEFLDSL